ncbi:phosphate ABC transporter, permease protein PstA [Pseudidiomarina sediminum]|uniref:Phosphate transport system permease protein PstA n=1 Tax=Pseudidiomarina sediminum TaxID=431675 RepID=A0A432Z0Z5_9GAMM|nr:phosphate ABC transporter permease PstA [Pseudidiomarina sediminum]MBY6065023.1 phosphate ABC transporter permease PstA [Pseudidiomarina sediminum]RUO69866.1 phosphate ABC transporter, permease protein PstA [Pseudidiomarina sediminum]
MKQWFNSGKPWIWLTAGAVSVSLIAVIGLLMLIGARGLSFFWPAEIHQMEVRGTDGTVSTVIGEVYDTETVPMERLRESGVQLENYNEDTLERWLLKIGNREYVPLDFTWVLAPQVIKDETPADLAVLERSKDGNFYGYVVDVLENGNSVVNDADVRDVLQQRIDRVVELNEQASDLQDSEIGAINYALNNLRLERRSLELQGQLTSEEEARISAEEAQLRADYQVLEQQLFELREQASRDEVVMRDMRGVELTLPMYRMLAVHFPNDMGFFAKLGHFFVQIGKFVSDDPREANTEGGVFPAIFGTVFMVLLMSVIVTPFGVIAAIYLHEYAGKNAITRLIRIAVINLAGVPSIVYGVFGLGFFVYMVGGSLDQLFYPEALPSPTFGTPGVMWAAITLAILTLPVVIVSTEEGLSRIPSTLREGSLALGATKAETLWRIIIPMASPAIMTGLILAVARAAGEVAPLMLVGVVKSAPMLPVDGNFPYFHLDRKFMHLGFHIYDVGFQSPNVEAARPLVYATSFLLVTVIVGLNLTAIGVRNHLREKYRSLEH